MKIVFRIRYGLKFSSYTTPALTGVYIYPQILLVCVYIVCEVLSIISNYSSQRTHQKLNNASEVLILHVRAKKEVLHSLSQS